MVKTKLEKKLEQALVPVEEQPYEVPDNWLWVRVKELLSDISSGFACARKNEVSPEEEEAYPHLRPNNIGFLGRLNLESLIFIPQNMVKEGKDKLFKDTILFNNTNSVELVGRSVLIEEEMNFAYSNHITKLEVNSDIVEPIWFNYAINKLWQDGFFAEICKKWVGQAGVNQTMLKKEVSIPVPPLNEQKRIVAKVESMLDKIQQAREKIKAVEESFENRKAAILAKAFRGELTAQWRAENEYVESVEVLLEEIEEAKKKSNKRKKKLVDIEQPYELPNSWEWVTFHEIIRSTRYGSSSKAYPDIDGIPVLRMGNIEDGKIVTDDLKYLPYDHKDVKKLKLEEGDLLFNRTNSYELVGKTALVSEEEAGQMTFASYLIRVKLFKKDLLSKYICYFINSFIGRKQLLSTVTQQVGQANINAKKMSSIQVPIASEQEIKKILELVEPLLDKMEESQAIVEATKEKLELLEKTILAKAFRGELGTNDPKEESAVKLVEEVLSEG
ncbi:type I restriction enzyme S subunit [Orenia metallireducens]|uniref:Type I restriction enzyme, S subunit n=1 Tax=Orenia metallireducens TaxID=1413210 RepID=A0A285IHY8_9FIRM|nr:restriction endonuclease subunit S [Orenia metallireducens]PRX18488.1 type I restriction enzyme S subunit [Orenia metallireducens]SNY46686.1 type I restriction enzyme, S subunit [Orenia metallireducens]